MHVVYRGPSLIDGGPITAAVTGTGRPSRNRKTGPMAQLWIIPAGRPVWDAVKAGKDTSVCGTCPRRPSTAGYGRAGCYVARVAWREASLIQRYATGPINLVGAIRALAGRPIRLGAYGDPGALPFAVIDALCQSASRWTGYTRRWRERSDLREYCHASVETELSAWHAWLEGWRTFRVLGPSDAALPRIEHACPAAAGRTTCDRCLACCGTSGRSAAIREH